MLDHVIRPRDWELEEVEYPVEDGEKKSIENLDERELQKRLRISNESDQSRWRPRWTDLELCDEQSKEAHQFRELGESDLADETVD